MFNRKIKNDIEDIKLQLQWHKDRIEILELKTRKPTPRGRDAIALLPDDLGKRLSVLYKKLETGSLLSRSQTEELKRFGIIAELY
jgi:hypothetical protein